MRTISTKSQMDMRLKRGDSSDFESSFTLQGVRGEEDKIILGDDLEELEFVPDLEKEPDRSVDIVLEEGEKLRIKTSAFVGRLEMRFIHKDNKIEDKTLVTYLDQIGMDLFCPQECSSMRARFNFKGGKEAKKQALTSTMAKGFTDKSEASQAKDDQSDYFYMATLSKVNLYATALMEQGLTSAVIAMDGQAKAPRHFSSDCLKAVQVDASSMSAGSSLIVVVPEGKMLHVASIGGKLQMITRWLNANGSMDVNLSPVLRTLNADLIEVNATNSRLELIISKPLEGYHLVSEDQLGEIKSAFGHLRFFMADLD